MTNQGFPDITSLNPWLVPCPNEYRKQILSFCCLATSIFLKSVFMSPRFLLSLLLLQWHYQCCLKFVIVLSLSSGISHGAPWFTCIPEHQTRHRTLAEILLLLSKRKGFRSSGLRSISHLPSLVGVHCSDLQDCYAESWFSSYICLMECSCLIWVSWTCLYLQSLKIPLNSLSLLLLESFLAWYHLKM